MLIKFAIIGVGNTCVSFSIIYISWILGFSDFFSIIAGYGVGTLNGLFWHIRLFKRRLNVAFKPTFLAKYCATVLLSAVFTSWLKIGLEEKLDFAEPLALCFSIALTFPLLYVVLRKLFLGYKDEE